MEYNITNHKRQNKTNNYSSIVIEISNKVRFYCIIVIVTIGIIGNLISLFIFTRPNLNKKTNTGILFTLLCIFNLLTFIEEAFLGSYTNELFNYIISVDQLYTNIDLIIETSLSEILPWIQVLICFDRFILVIYPMRAHIMRKKVSLNNHIYIYNCDFNLYFNETLRFCYSQSLSLLLFSFLLSTRHIISYLNLK